MITVKSRSAAQLKNEAQWLDKVFANLKNQIERLEHLDDPAADMRNIRYMLEGAAISMSTIIKRLGDISRELESE